MSILYTLVGSGDESNITVFVTGEATPLVAHSDHPNFDAIVAEVTQGAPHDEERIIELFDPAKAVAQRFERLSERVTVANGRVYFDGDEVDNALTTQIIRCMNEGVEDFMPLVNFFEKVSQNPNAHSREQLYEWLRRREFTITDDGDIVGYKGVRKDDTHGFVSISHGPAIVDGESVNGAVPNPIGAVVEMPRGQVHHDPSQGCSTGLHVGTYEYANSFARGGLLEVAVNPRDVVSVPTDCGWAKVRTCRYKVLNTIDAPWTTAVRPDPDGYVEGEDDLYEDDGWQHDDDDWF